MKLIKSVEYFELDVTDPFEVECRVTFMDGSQEIFVTDEDLQMIREQLQKQLKHIQNQE